MGKALVIGGSSGLGLSITVELLKKGKYVYIVGRNPPDIGLVSSSIRDRFVEATSFMELDLNSEDYHVFDEIRDIDTLVITAGFGRVALLENLTEVEIRNLIRCNELSPIQIIRKYYDFIKSKVDFKCAVIVSIAGLVVSPYLSAYGAAKAGLASFIASVNVELAASKCNNRILNCSPGALIGTAFNGGINDISKLNTLSSEIIERMDNKDTLFIPNYEAVYKDVIRDYRDNPEQFGLKSYKYKETSNRVNTKPQVVIGYLSGTFDLFHIGHLNLLRRAKSKCDYLIVGVHESGAWKGKETFIPFEERKQIIGSVRFVDKVVTSFTEDTDAWTEYQYDKLFVGSDYKGSERFRKYELFFKDRGVEIIYFPYTKGTSSTQLRETLSSISSQ